MVGLSPCKANCLPKNPIPAGVNKNLPTLILSTMFLSIKPVNVGAPLKKPPNKPSAPANRVPTIPVSDVIASNPHLPLPGPATPSSFGNGLSINGCANPAILKGSETSLYGLVIKFILGSKPAGTFKNCLVPPFSLLNLCNSVILAILSDEVIVFKSNTLSPVKIKGPTFFTPV